MRHPFDLAQNDFLRFQALLPFLSFEGGVVTAVCSLLPGLSLRYFLTPLAVIPPPASLPVPLPFFTLA